MFHLISTFKFWYPLTILKELTGVSYVLGEDHDQEMPFSMTVHSCGLVTEEIKLDGLLDDEEVHTEEEEHKNKVYDWE